MSLITMPRPDVSFFPEHEVGGAQYFFARMARYLIDQGNYQVTVVDYDDGFMERELWDRPHRLVRYDPGKPAVLDRPTILVLSLSYIPFISTQIAFSAITYSLSVVMIDAWGLQGVAWAHAIKYTILLFVPIFRYPLVGVYQAG